MKKNVFFFYLITLSLFSAAQDSYHPFNRVQSAGFSGTGANIDVVYHRINWRINPDTSVRYIKGSVFTRFKTIQNSVSSISFDLNAVLTIDSVYFRTSKLPAANINRSGNIVSISLGTVLPNNTLDSVIIFYKGSPPASSGAATGFVKSTSTTAGNYITTLSESYEDRDWWPCKADMQDKIDSMDITVNVPWKATSTTDTFWVAANGVLVDSTIIGNSRNFAYKTRYPIATYLVFVSVARFTRYYNGTINVSGTQVPNVYYILAGNTNISNVLIALDKIPPVLNLFSQRFGDYPFKAEKHGFYDGLVGAGGMEHQTFSGMATSQLTRIRTLVHELMHQWFGDNITMATWNDLWLAEGFASYGEVLAAEAFPAYGLSPFNIRNAFKSSAISLNMVSAWIPDANIVSSNTIWNTNYGSAVYDRGFMIVSMLRTMVGDAKFYEALSNFQRNIKGKTANTDSLKNYFNAVTGRDLSPFFNDFVGGSGNGVLPVGGIGNPKYVINWATPAPKKIQFAIGAQSSSTGSNVSYFRSPIVLHIKGATTAEDTTICFFDWGNGNLSYAGNGISAPIPGNLLSYNLSFEPITVFLDDSAKTLVLGSTQKLSTVPLLIRQFNGVRINNKNKLVLKIQDAAPILKVTLLRSRDGIQFESIGDMQYQSYSDEFLYEDQTIAKEAFYRASVKGFSEEKLSNIVMLSNSSNSMSVYPVPCKNELYIYSQNNSHPLTFRLLNKLGQVVKETSTAEISVKWDVRLLPPGSYLVQQWHKGKLIESRKIIIEK